jgi:hypothetical protein
MVAREHPPWRDDRVIYRGVCFAAGILFLGQALEVFGTGYRGDK